MNCIYFVQIILFRFITLKLSVKFASQICHENISTSLDGAYIVGFGIDIIVGHTMPCKFFFSWGASMNSRGWTHYHLYSSVPNSSACTFINFEGKIHLSRSYFGLHVCLFRENFPPCRFTPPCTFIELYYFSLFATFLQAKQSNKWLL